LRGLEKLAVDANPVLSSLLGGRARDVFLLEKPLFYTTAFNFREAEKYIPRLAEKRGLRAEDLYLALSAMPITVCEEDLYAPKMRAALRLLGDRDPDDCHLLALALALGCPIWSNDRDFEGCGVRVYGTAELAGK
jgi:predicted nucleic acid-binding protein